MPKLSRMRLVSIGHPRARFDDLLLDFRDQEGRATDTVLWLRNGGGKSSLLNLFYSVVRPRQTDFLGGKGGEEHRRLADYVQHDDCAIVACEWQLDGADSLFDGEPLRYLTFVFYEHHSSSPTDGLGVELQRLYLAAESRADVPELTLEGLPLTTISEDGQTMRRSLANFRRVWRDLQVSHPDRDVFVTEKQIDWTRQLESRGIDAQLFRYQLHMNSREGGVTELFTFADADSFVDFLLETAFDPQDAETVRGQVSTFHKELLRRHNELQPDHDLCRGLLERFTPFESVARNRAELRGQLTAYNTSRMKLQAGLDLLSADASAERQNYETRLEGCGATAVRQRSMAERLRRLARRLRYRALTTRLSAAEIEQTQRRAEMEAASRQEDLWTAAVPLARALDCERQAREYREQLRTRQSDHVLLIQQLTEAATALYSGLSHEIQRLDGAAEERQRESRHLRDEARQRREQATECAKKSAAAAAKADEIEVKLKAANGHWERLIVDCVALRTENAAESNITVARLAEEVSATQTQLDEVMAQETAVQHRRETLTEERTRLASLLRECDTFLKDLDERLAQRQSDHDALARDATLLSVLQVESVDLDKVCKEAIALGRDVARRTQEAILQLRLERADDEWATEYLRDQGHLPPNRDVLALLEWMKQRSIVCWSGWAYIEANLVPDQRRAAIARRPHLASGVIIGDEKALDLLRQADSLPNFAGPVAVGNPQQLLGDAISDECLVVGPSDDGLFDSVAAGRAEAEMLQRIARSRSEEGNREQSHDAVLRLVGRLEQYVEAYPTGWLNDVLGKRLQSLDDITQQKRRAEEVAAAKRHLQGELEGLVTSRKALHERHTALTVAQQRAIDFTEQHGRHLSSWMHERDSLQQEEQRSARQQQELNCRADQMESEAITSDAQAQQLITRVVLLREERARVRYAKPSDLPLPETSLDDARLRYQTVLAEYEEKVGADTLEQLAAHSDREAESARRRFEAVRKPDVCEQVVVQAIHALVAGTTAEEAKDRAAGQHWKAKQTLGQVATRIIQLREKLSDLAYSADDESTEEPEYPIADDLSPEEAEAEAIRAEGQAMETQREAEIAEKQAQQCREKINVLETTLIRIHAFAQRVNDVGVNHARLLEEANVVAGSDTAEASDDKLPGMADYTAAVDRLAQGLADAARRWADLDRIADQALKELHEWCRHDRFVSLPDGVAMRFAKLTGLDMERKLEYFREHLMTRLEQIDADLAEADKQRGIVVDAVMSSVNQALELLTRIARLSRLPDTVPGGGRHFLEVTTSAPENPAERRARVAELVDEVVQSGSLDSGLELVQRATRRVARPLRVRVLHPDLDSSGTRVLIHQMANFSGGERLTGAILLYCALARLRGQQLGTTTKRTSVLLLDNPIGTVSRVRYLDLQREVARALDVQLIYATGVHDIDAVASLPNIIRLRNTRRDVRRGHRVVEPEPQAPGEPQLLVDAVRVHILPPNGSAPAGS